MSNCGLVVSMSVVSFKFGLFVEYQHSNKVMCFVIVILASKNGSHSYTNDNSISNNNNNNNR